MPTTKQREKILEVLRQTLEPRAEVHAMWEGGAAVFQRVDEWSDDAAAKLARACAKILLAAGCQPVPDRGPGGNDLADKQQQAAGWFYEEIARQDQGS